MVKLHKALVILPGDFPGEPGGFAAVCRMLGLVPNSLGYAIYLAQTAAGSVTLVGAELGDPAGLTAADAGDDAEFPESPHPQNIAQQLGTSARPTGIQNDDSFHGRDRGAASSTARLLGEYCRLNEDAAVGTEPADHPSARVVLNLRSSRLEGVRVWNAKATRYAVAKLDGTVDEKIRQTAREAVARQLAHTAVGAIWKAPHRATGSDYDNAFEISKFLLEPQTFLPKVINGVARAAATHAGFGGPAARLAGELAQVLCQHLIEPGTRDQPSGDMVTVLDLDLYARSVRQSGYPALGRQDGLTAVQVIDSLLDSRPDRQPAMPGRSAVPGRVTRESRAAAQPRAVPRREPGIARVERARPMRPRRPPPERGGLGR